MAGLLGGGLQQMMGGMQGPLGTVQNYMQQNPYAMLALGMGLLSGNGTSDAFGKGLQGLLAGSQYDDGRKEKAAAEKIKQTQLGAVSAFLGQRDLPKWRPGGQQAVSPNLFPKTTRDFLSAFPEQTAQMAFDSFKPPKPGEPYTLGANDVRYGPDNKPLASNPKADSSAPSFRALVNPQERAQYGIDQNDKRPWQVDANGKLYLPGGAGTTITNNLSPQDTTIDAGLGRQYLEVNAEGRKAQDTLNNLSIMEKTMSDPNFYSGAFPEAALFLKRGIAALGGDQNAAGSMELFNAQAKKAALDNMGGSLGTGFSNADRDFVVEQVPTLGNTPEGNKRLIEINKAIAKRKIEIAQLARDYAGKHGNKLDINFDNDLRTWAEEHPLFANQKPMPPPAGGSGAAPPPGVVPYTDFFK